MGESSCHFLILVVHSLLVRRETLVPAYLGDLHGLFCLDPCEPRDTWRIFDSRGSHGFARIYPCDSRDPWNFHFQGISRIYTDGSA